MGLIKHGTSSFAGAEEHPKIIEEILDKGAHALPGETGHFLKIIRFGDHIEAEYMTEKVSAGNCLGGSSKYYLLPLESYRRAVSDFSSTGRAMIPDCRASRNFGEQGTKVDVELETTEGGIIFAGHKISNITPGDMFLGSDAKYNLALKLHSGFPDRPTNPLCYVKDRIDFHYYDMVWCIHEWDFDDGDMNEDQGTAIGRVDPPKFNAFLSDIVLNGAGEQTFKSYNSFQEQNIRSESPGSKPVVYPDYFGKTNLKIVCNEGGFNFQVEVSPPK